MQSNPRDIEQEVKRDGPKSAYLMTDNKGKCELSPEVELAMKKLERTAQSLDSVIQEVTNPSASLKATEQWLVENDLVCSKMEHSVGCKKVQMEAYVGMVSKLLSQLTDTERELRYEKGNAELVLGTQCEGEGKRKEDFSETKLDLGGEAKDFHARSDSEDEDGRNGQIGEYFGKRGYDKPLRKSLCALTSSGCDEARAKSTLARK